MAKTSKSDIIGEENFIPILKKGIHGGFIDKSELSAGEKEYCKSRSWVEKRVRFSCPECNITHSTQDDRVICPSRQIPIDEEDIDLTEGYQIDPRFQLPAPVDDEYRVEICEARRYIDPSEVEEKTVFFIPNCREVSLYEPTGRVVVAPIERLPEMYTNDHHEELVNEIFDLVGDSVDWGKLDASGSDFQDITYNLLRLEDEYYNVSPGGTGADQGKDGYCYQEIGRREIKTMVQVKFNNEGSGLNADSIAGMAMDAESLDCMGLLVTTVKTTGDLETKLGNPNYISSMHYLDVWGGEKMRDRISSYPELIERYFID